MDHPTNRNVVTGNVMAYKGLILTQNKIVSLLLLVHAGLELVL